MMREFLSEFKPYEFPVFTDGVRLPEVKITSQQREELNVAPDISNLDYLKRLVWKGLKEKIASGKIKQSMPECVDRLNMEFEVFVKTGTIDYILLLKNVFGPCEDAGIPRGPARGSASGSFAFYCCDLISINPLDHNLYFSRFLSEARIKPKMINGNLHIDGKMAADFDGDVGYEGRPSVIKRLENDYPKKICKISTIQYFTAKTALKETLKSYLEYSEEESKYISDLIEVVFGKVDSIDKTLEKNKQFKEFADRNPDTISIVKKIEGLIRTKGVHASGMLLSYYDTDDIIPTELSSDDSIVSGFDMHDALTISIKVDILGLRTLDILKKCSDLVGINFHDIDVNDKSIYDYLQSSDLFYGLFQIEDGITKKVVTQVGPKNINQLVACVAIGRPGSLKYIPDYVKYVKTGDKKSVYPSFDNILEDTAGLIIYQEQINRICQEIYKMSPVDADSVRAAISKKIRDDLKKWEEVLYRNGKEHGVPEMVTKYFWDTCNASADYLFNLGHACAYSYITCYTVYLKTKYPLQFYLSCLSFAAQEQEPLQCVNAIRNEMRQKGYRLLPPNIFKSKEEYSIDGNDILTGLSAIKGVSEKALEKLRHFDKTKTNKFSLFKSAQDAHIPINIVTALIWSGCLSPANGESRAKMILELELYKILTPKEEIMINNFGPQYNFDLISIVKDCGEKLKSDNGKLLIKESRLTTIRSKFAPYLEKYKYNTKFESLTSYILEQEFLGFSYSNTLKSIYDKEFHDLQDIQEIKGEMNDMRVRFVGIVTETKKAISKKKTPYMKIEIKDDFGQIKAMLFRQDRIDDLKSFNGKELEEGDIVLVNGIKKEDAIFADSLTIQENPTIIKKSQLPK